MTRSSPAAKRVAAILSFIASHPGQAFSLTELSRALKLSTATCHSLLTGLVEVGFLYRITSKTYVLGPELAAIGRAAANDVSPLLVAQPEMRALADEFDVVCSAAFFDGTFAEIRERAMSLSFVGSASPVGSRFKVRIPYAAAYLAWMSDEQIAAWIDAFTPAPSPAQRELQYRSIAFTRKHGFSMLMAAPSLGLDDMPMVPATELEPEGRYAVSAIVAPVFAAQDKLAFLLTMMGFNRAMNGAEVMLVAERLRAACARLSGFIQGRGTTPVGFG